MFVVIISGFDIFWVRHRKVVCRGAAEQKEERKEAGRRSGTAGSSSNLRRSTAGRQQTRSPSELVRSATGLASVHSSADKVERLIQPAVGTVGYRRKSSKVDEQSRERVFLDGPQNASPLKAVLSSFLRIDSIGSCASASACSKASQGVARAKARALKLVAEQVADALEQCAMRRERGPPHLETKEAVSNACNDAWAEGGRLRGPSNKGPSTSTTYRHRATHALAKLSSGYHSYSRPRAPREAPPLAVFRSTSSSSLVALRLSPTSGRQPLIHDRPTKTCFDLLLTSFGSLRSWTAGRGTRLPAAGHDGDPDFSARRS